MDAGDRVVGSADVATSPDALDRAGMSIGDLGSVISAASLDWTLLHDNAVGHSSLASALREFTELWEQRLDELAEHIRAMSAALLQMGESYRDTDAAAAHRLVDLDPDWAPGRRP